MENGEKDKMTWSGRDRFFICKETTIEEMDEVLEDIIDTIIALDSRSEEIAAVIGTQKK